MRAATTLAAIVAAIVAAFLIGLSFATPVVKEDLTTAKTITSLEYSVKNLQAEAATYKSQLDDLLAHPRVVTETIRVRDDAEIAKLKAEIAGLTELQKARQRPESLPVGEPVCAEVPRYQAAVPSVVPQPVYQRRRLLFGRFR